MEIRRTCEFPYCAAAATHGAYCGAHARIQTKRPTRTALGYDNRWLRFRAWYLMQHPLCKACAEHGRITASAEVHHVEKLRDHPELKFVQTNLEALCKSCHSKKRKT